MLNNWYAITIVMVLGVTGVNGSLTQNQAAEFIVPPKATHKKKMSVNALKEHIGGLAKDLFELSTRFEHNAGEIQCSIAHVQQQCIHQKVLAQNDGYKALLQLGASYNVVSGNVQKELSALQRKCSSIVEKLIDNDGPFKKASKKMLEKTSQLLSSVQEQLQQSVTKVQQIGTELKTSSAKKNAAEVLKSACSGLEKQCQCLKQVYADLNNDECLQKA